MATFPVYTPNATTATALNALASQQDALDQALTMVGQQQAQQQTMTDVQNAQAGPGGGGGG